jgi:hypothetical protein
MINLAFNKPLIAPSERRNMKKLLGILAMMVILLTAISCQTGGSDSLTPIPTKDLLPVVGEEAPDDIITTPAGPAYRANLQQEGVENPWPPIENTMVALSSGAKKAHIFYRDYIETEAGETRNNILNILATVKKIRNLNLYAVSIPTGMEVAEGMRWNPPVQDAWMLVLVIETAQDVEPGQYTVEIGVEINGKDYGTLPFVIEVLE